tara:strand:+ start:180 stop:800 length:621 start_codon:yes stop_codon:yes gene_type:complete
MSEILPFIVMLLGGFFIRLSLISAGQMWAKSYSQTIAFLILPIITYIITKTIYGNIALSLGMIGALSIVRFRHPVKSALELIMYFALITIGIAASVNNNYAIILIVLNIIVIIGVKFLQKFYKENNKKNFYNISFNEGVDLNQIEICANEKIDILDSHENLKSLIIEDESKEIIYRLAFEDKKKLNELKLELEKNKNIKKIDVNYI